MIGAPILFGEKCRIKHLFSLKYISVTREGKVAAIYKYTVY